MGKRPRQDRSSEPKEDQLELELDRQSLTEEEGSVSALRVLATELSRRVSEPGTALTGPEATGRLLIDLIGHKDREHFVVLHLDSRHRVRATETVSVGTLNGALVHPREVFKAAILANSAAIICGHNHPSGDLDPSQDDIEIHARLKQAGHLLGIEVLDFLIVSASGYRSFATG